MKLITTEKAVRLIELNNPLIFEFEIRKKKAEIKKEIEEMFNVKIDNINSLTKENKKIVYVKLNKENPAIDVATKLGMI
jgi:large subunit ribosomal protein L23